MARAGKAKAADDEPVVEEVVPAAEPQAAPEPDPEPDATQSEPGAAGEPITATPPEAGGPEPVDPEAAAAAPLAPPVKTSRAVAPHPGDSASAPAAAVRTAPGPHIRLVDDEGNEVHPDDLFHPQQGPAMVLVAKRRVYQEYMYPQTATPMRHLVVNGGVSKPVWQATQLVAELKAAMAEQAAAGGGGQ